MKAYRNNWYYIGGIIFAVLAIILGLFGEMISPMRRIMIVLFMCRPINLKNMQFQEGFPQPGI